MNGVDEVELKRAKELMNQHFERNRLKPGDQGFVYDLQVGVAYACACIDCVRMRMDGVSVDGCRARIAVPRHDIAA